ncbi:MAG: phosphate-starvation-inducible PsiE family protein [Euryarchaeota archaeon]|nr:phosphate-starvation-inducible PsiE family protein [Euryarchaeota archaeon]
MSIRKYFQFRNFRELQPVDKIITIFSYVPVLCYLLVALLLSVLALFSLINAGNLIFHVFGNLESVTVGVYQAFEMYHAIHAILLTVIIIELFETVTIYLRTKQIPILILLLVGLTAMIRHILIFSFDEVEAVDMAATAIVILVIVCGIYLLKNNSNVTETEERISEKASQGEENKHEQEDEPPENVLYLAPAPAPNTSSDSSPIQSGTDITIRYISYILVFCYIITALLLTIIAFISLFIAGEIVMLVSSGQGGGFGLGIEHAIYAIFLTIIIIGLFETVQAYLTSRRIPIYALLVVGVTVTIRYILLYTLGGIDSIEVIAISAVMVALFAGLYLLHRNPQKNEDKRKHIITKRNL